MTTGDDKTIKIWDTETLKFKTSLIGHNNWVLSARASTDMVRVCSGGEDKKLIIWDVEKRKEIQKYDCFDAPITCTAFHPNQNCILASTASKTISMFDARH